MDKNIWIDKWTNGKYHTNYKDWTNTSKLKLWNRIGKDLLKHKDHIKFVLKE